MKFYEILQDIILSSGVAVLLPILLYLGISIYYPKPQFPTARYDTLTTVERAIYDEQVKEYDAAYRSFTAIAFYILMLAGLLFIILGVFTPIPALGLGLIGGGILTIFTGLTNIRAEIINFGILLILLFTLVFIIIIRRKRIRAD